MRKLAGQTAIYGLPTIVGRFLNYFLVPLYTYQFTNPSDFGVITEFYSYISFFNIILTYGFETAFFNFSVKETNKENVYSTAFFSIITTTVLFFCLSFIFRDQIADLIKYPGQTNLITWILLIIATDALAAIPFARIREQVKPARFAFIKSVNIAVNILLNLFFIWFCKDVYDSKNENFLGFVELVYNPEIGIGYVFIANLIANVVTLLLLYPEFIKTPFRFFPGLWKKMMVYAFPLLIVGLAGMVNETVDRLLLKYLLPENIAMHQVGVYGACYKISILMTIFIQAFRYAAEPFFFSNAKNVDSKTMYADVMKYFVITCSFIFLATLMNMEWIKKLISQNYREGLSVVPVLLLANLFLGMFFNLSIWYKLTQKTFIGAYITVFGAILTLGLNFWLIPKFGYYACAWTTLICYFSMVVLSYFAGQRFFPVNYDLKRILGYLLLSVFLFLMANQVNYFSDVVNVIIKNLAVILFVSIVYLIEKPQFRNRKNENQSYK